MPCEECKKLDDAVAYALRALQEQRHVNRQWGLGGKVAKSEEVRLEQAYNLATAERNLHKGACHPETGHKVVLRDIHVRIRKGRKRP